MHFATGSRMAEAELAGVQGEPLPRPSRMGGQFAAIAGLAQDWMPLLRHVDANLVAPAGFEGDADMGRLTQVAEHFVVGDCQFPLLGGRDRMPIQLVISCQKAANGALGRLQSSGHQCFVTPLRLAFGELLAEQFGDLQTAGNDHQSRDIPVESMDRKELGRMAGSTVVLQLAGEQGEQRVFLAVWRRHGEQAGRLFDHQQLVVCVDDSQVQAVNQRLLLGAARCGPMNLHPVSRLEGPPTVERLPLIHFDKSAENMLTGNLRRTAE